VRAELGSLFPGQKVLEASAFRISRDAELGLDDEGGRDYLQAIEEELLKRRQAQTVRLEVEHRIGDGLLKLLKERLNVGNEDVSRVQGPLDVRALFPLTELPALEDLRDAPLKPLQALDQKEQEDIFGVLEQRDVMLLHPYESFDPVVALVSRAS